MKCTNTRFTRVIYGFCFPLLLLAASQSAHSSIITNGGFETGDLTGWSFSGNIIVGFVGGNSCCTASEGIRYANFNGGDHTPNGLLSQTFTTVADTEYFLDFDFGKGGPGAGSASLNIQVTGINTLLAEVVTNITGGSPGTYSSFSYSFIADSTESSLIFADNSSGTVSFDVMLDKVSVSNVPIPTAVWLFCSGLFTLLGFRHSFS